MLVNWPTHLDTSGEDGLGALLVFLAPASAPKTISLPYPDVLLPSPDLDTKAPDFGLLTASGRRVSLNSDSPPPSHLNYTDVYYDPSTTQTTLYPHLSSSGHPLQYQSVPLLQIVDLGYIDQAYLDPDSPFSYFTVTRANLTPSGLNLLKSLEARHHQKAIILTSLNT